MNRRFNDQPRRLTLRGRILLTALVMDIGLILGLVLAIAGNFIPACVSFGVAVLCAIVLPWRRAFGIDPTGEDE